VRQEPLRDAQAALAEQLDDERVERIRAEAATKLGAMREELDALREAMRIDVDDLELPTPVVPAAELNGHQPPAPLVSSAWSFAEQCRRLLDSKGYQP
jgi:hypothetical protein